MSMPTTDKSPVSDGPVMSASALPPANKVGNAHKPTTAKKSAKNFNSAGFHQKSPEDMHDEIMELKKSMAAMAEENSSLKAKARKLEEDITKKNEELRRSLADKKSSSSNVVVNNLKQKIFKLEQLLKEKEITIKKFESDMKSTKIHEMKIQMDTYYREIIRLKNLNNLRETAKNSNEDSIQQILITNKELEDENMTLRKDLERALAVSGSQLKNEDYINMSKTNLLAIISDLENKINSMKTTPEKKPVDLGPINDLPIESLKLQLEQYKEEKSNMESSLQRMKEDRLHYHELAETREQELRALRLLIEHMQKQIEPKKHNGTPRAAATALTTTRLAKHQLSSGSDTEPSTSKSAAAKPSVFDRLAQNNPKELRRTATRTMAQASASSSSDNSKQTKERRLKTSPPAMKPERVAQKSAPAKGPASKAADASNSASSKSSLSSRGKAPPAKSAGPSSLARREPKEHDRPAVIGNKVGAAAATATKSNSPPATSAARKSPRRPTTTSPRQSAHSRDGKTNKGAANVSLDSSAKKKQKKTVEESASTLVEPGSPTPVNKSVTYTVLKTLNVTSNEPNKAKAVEVGRPRASEAQIQTFRQNVAAKKIQKMWKTHQTETHVKKQTERVQNFRQNRAARTIQRGWKCHSKKIPGEEDCEQVQKKSTDRVDDEPQKADALPSVSSSHVESPASAPKAQDVPPETPSSPNVV